MYNMPHREVVQLESYLYSMVAPHTDGLTGLPSVPPFHASAQDVASATSVLPLLFHASFQKGQMWGRESRDPACGQCLPAV